VKFGCKCNPNNEMTRRHQGTEKTERKRKRGRIYAVRNVLYQYFSSNTVWKIC